MGKQRVGRPVPPVKVVDCAMREAQRVGNAKKLPEVLRSIAVVVSAQGVIDNGGLRYFFEANFPGAPPYSLFVRAYRAIGAAAEADHLAQAVRLFPFDRPHKRVKQRNEYLKRIETEGGKEFQAFERLSDALCGNENVERCLEAYIAANPVRIPAR